MNETRLMHYLLVVTY